MSARAESSQSALDWLKWLVVVGLVGGGIYANWYYQDASLLYRILAGVGIGLVATLVGFQTERGHNLWVLLKEARVEIRRVVWPTRQETTQTTFIVVMLVLIFALILWLLDTLLGWFVSSLIG